MKKSQIAAKAPAINASDRFGFTLFMSVVVNAIVVLGVTFAPHDPNDEESPPTLEVVLVPTQSERAPEIADFLAQANQLGSGQADDKRRPTSPTPAPYTSSDDNTSPAFIPQLKVAPKPDNLDRELMTSASSDWKISTTKQQDKEIPDLKLKTPTDLSKWAEMIAKVQNELDVINDREAKRPRLGNLSKVAAKSAVFAQYQKDWQHKVERVGSQNFPEEARRRKLQGDLLLGVAVNHDGTIADVQIRRSSGNKVLDDAALRIVHQAAPYAPFPPAVRKEFDVLYISRTWQFLPGGVFDTTEAR